MRLPVIDSHTEGEPTRVVLGDPLRLARPAANLRRALEEGHDWLRRALCLEPRGSEIAVGAYLTGDPTHGYEAVFFNNAGYLGMCGHATVGVIVSLAHAGLALPGPVELRTPGGPVRARLLGRSAVEFENVPSRRHLAGVTLDVPGHGSVTGDVAYGGNWFFLVSSPSLDLRPANAPDLLAFTQAVMGALRDQGVTGDGGAPIDHVELFGPPTRPGADSRNFVLCPGGQFDRSPCGTGTSAKLACLVAEGRLAPGQTWRQEGFAGGVFEAVAAPHPEGVVPTLTGRAYVTAETTLVIDPEDPMRDGLDWR